MYKYLLNGAPTFQIQISWDNSAKGGQSYVLIGAATTFENMQLDVRTSSLNLTLIN